MQNQKHKQQHQPKDSIVATCTRAAASAFLAACMMGAASSPAAAADDATVLNHNYADPLHPLCERKIEVAADGKTFHYSGTAVGPKGDTVLRGCTPQEIKDFGLRQGAFDGFVLDGNRVSVGDGIHEGVWEPANSVKTTLGFEDQDGIRWNDGNKWVVIDAKKGPNKVGEGIFYAYIGFSTLAGVKGVTDGIRRKQQEKKEAS